MQNDALDIIDGLINGAAALGDDAVHIHITLDKLKTIRAALEPKVVDVGALKLQCVGIAQRNYSKEMCVIATIDHLASQGHLSKPDPIEGLEKELRCVLPEDEDSAVMKAAKAYLDLSKV